LIATAVSSLLNESKGETMKRIIFASLVLTSISAHADWSGALRTRYRTFRYDDQLSSATSSGDQSVQNRRTYDYRAALKYDAKVGENVTSEVAIRTTGSAVTFYTTANSSADSAVGVELANLKWTCLDEKRDFLAIGRQKPVFQYENFMQNVWDNDVRMDGFAAQYGKGAFAVAGGAYVLGALNLGAASGSTYTMTEASQNVASLEGEMSYLFGVQPSWTWKDENKVLTFALARYQWNQAVGTTFNNRVHMGYNSQTLNPNADTGTVNVHNPRQWHALVKVEIPKYELKAALEWLQNKEMFYGNGDTMDRNAWSGSLIYKDTKKAGDWMASYGYTSKGLAATPNAFSFSDVLADTNAHVAEIMYMPADQMTVGVTGFFMREKSRRMFTGPEVSNAQEQKARVLFFTAGVKF
jgi:hypothetical protein